MGNLESWEYKEAEAVVVLAKNEVIEHLCAAIGTRPPYKDGNQWCILLGEDLQSGTCGFGGTIQDAFVDFLLSFTRKELPEVDLEKEIDWQWGQLDLHLATEDGEEIPEHVAWIGWSDFDAVARHFYELRKKSASPV